jgi:phosphatidylinositol alpha-1,6-mannosyltransferase
MKVLLLTPDFPPAPGGIQVVAHRLAAHSTRLEIEVVALDGPGASAFDREQAFPVTRAGPAWLPHQLRVGALNARALERGLRIRPDALLSLHIVTSPAAAALRRVRGTPAVQYLHADEMRGRPRLTRQAIRGAQAVVAVSSHTERLAAAAGAVPARTWRIPNGVDLPAHVSADRAGDPVVLTVGRLTQRYKGHDVLLGSLPLVRARVPGARWVVIGDGPLRPELEREAAAAGLDGAVSFLGSVADAERDAWLDRARVFAMPSRLPPGGVGGEGFGIAFLEASAHGLPVVAGNVGGALDAVEDGKTGVLVDPEDPAAVAGALAGLLEDPERAQRLGAAGAERAAGFSWDEIARRVEDVLIQVAG